MLLLRLLKQILIELSQDALYVLETLRGAISDCPNGNDLGLHLSLLAQDLLVLHNGSRLNSLDLIEDHVEYSQLARLTTVHDHVKGFLYPFLILRYGRLSPQYVGSLVIQTL